MTSFLPANKFGILLLKRDRADDSDGTCKNSIQHRALLTRWTSLLNTLI